MTSSANFYQQLIEWVESGTPLAVVTVTSTHGSAPTDAGSKMVVTSDGLVMGSVGGGRVEAKAIEHAQSMLRARQWTATTDWSLKADVGMTCGGRVALYYETHNVTTWQIVIFGAGHVTAALARVLHALPCHLTCIDPRRDWLERLPAGTNTILTEDPPAVVDTLADDSYVLCMTRGHASDRPVLKRIFDTGRQFPFLGVIGSKAKAAVLRKELLAEGVPADQIQFECPVGLPIGSNDPAEIAISISAQLLQVRDQSIRSRQPPDGEPN
jgi:xanthine dehydrogenase accessory factor